MKDSIRIFLFAMAISGWNCSGGGEEIHTPTPIPKPEEKPKIEITTNDPILSSEDETASVTFTSTDAWTIEVTESREVSWCSVSPTSGSKGTHTLTIKTVANDTYDERIAHIIIKVGKITQSIVVTQKQKDTIVVAKNEYFIEAAGGDLVFEVNTNVDLKIETSVGWIKQNIQSRGLVSNNLSFTISENIENVAREGLITISSGKLKQVVKVTQSQRISDSETGKGTGAELESGGGIEEG